MNKTKLLTAFVVVAGTGVLGFCAKEGVDRDTLAAIGSVLLALAGSLRSMILPEVKS